MPKARKLPLSCLFGINKPSGPPSMIILNRLQPLFSNSVLFQDPNGNSNSGGGGGGKKGGKGRRKESRIKLGQGGTLDPLADGVLVVGTNNATKHLAQFLSCTKEYRAIGLLGCSTDSYDSEGKRMELKPYEHITREMVEGILDRYRGEIEQIPPIFSALKMDGKPLYDYARSGTPLPRPIAARKVTVSQLSLLSFTAGGTHSYEYPKEEVEAKEKAKLRKVAKLMEEGGTDVSNLLDEEEESTTGSLEVPVSTSLPPIFEISMTVSSGTYVRSIIHDIGVALGSAAHVVKLTRTRQGNFALNSEAESSSAAVEPVLSAEITQDRTVEAIVDVATDAQPELPLPSVEAVPSDSTDDNPIPLPTLPESATAVVIPTEIAAIAPTPAIPSAVIEVVFSGGCIEWETLEAAIKDFEASRKGNGEGIALVRDGDGMLPWEAELLRRCQEI